MITRVRARQKDVTGYINAMRPGWLGNPFSLEEYTPEDSLVLYREYLEGKIITDPNFERKFLSIDENATIGCTCPLDEPCHVDIIIEVYHDFKKINRGNKHLKRGCPLPVSVIAKERQKYLNEARSLFWDLDHKEKAALVTERTILFMDKFRNQNQLDKYLEDINL